MKYEPNHPLVRETIREIMEQNLDAARAEREAARIHATPWETYTLPRPSPFTLPIYTAFNRETLVAQDPDRALDELARALYDEWKDDDFSN
jgi:Lhr-like helicase